ncbi:MAG: hypothetical protein JXA77_08590 [Bacteroidales bacterium]|nr:hypothetical protein [Bacteroidales bacterium]MBN2820988.1 hypothetical protein [Bacteroidales bacterium]
MKELFFGNTPLKNAETEIKGEIVSIEGEDFYKIENYDGMKAFFMSIVSNSDHWMFISSNGGLTCGRKNPETALFPYYTDDKIHDSSETSGPETVIIAEKAGKNYLWKPFKDSNKVYTTERNLYKSIYGNKLIFEEINHDIGICFSYSWMNSEKYGFIRESFLKNICNEPLSLEILDGVRNILPYGVNRGLQTNMSTLVDGYKQMELIPEAKLAVYTLSSILTDKAEPSEALKATTVWQTGLDDPKYLLSESQVNKFCAGEEVETEAFKKGVRGAFYVSKSFLLEPGKEQKWKIVAELNRGPAELASLIEGIKASDLNSAIEKDIKNGTNELKKLVDLSDGAQLTQDKLQSARHFANVLFNIMRGGVFNNQYQIPKKDFLKFIQNWNSRVFAKHKEFLNALEETTNYSDLLKAIKEVNDPDLYRLCLEYLPLSFSRRHGDPSRPWNQFSIDIKKPDGSENLYYQGNWRDIFQNWEALSFSFPEYIEGFIAKFLNASTADGYNPYRITKDGIDWEILDPEDPWSNIGYWGDHQLIYLLRLMELSARYHPGQIEKFLEEEIFVYANVPYEIKDYKSLLNAPRNSIRYNPDTEERVQQRVKQYGADGKMHFVNNEELYRVNLTEKILVTLLAKFSNFVPEGGIWMNTQRPEWNDANNALVGYGLSMVSLYNMRRFLAFAQRIFKKSAVRKFIVSAEVSHFTEAVIAIQSKYADLLKGEISDKNRKHMLDDLGNAGEKYRNAVYKGFRNEKLEMGVEHILEFIEKGILYLDHSIRTNKRRDGLYHSYNLIHFGENGYSVEYLHEMLEGQVSVLSSGLLSVEESFEVLEALRNSKMYRKDQRSYMLYPNRKLPLFREKNVIPKDKLDVIPFLLHEIEVQNNRFVCKDVNGQLHFNGKYRNAEELKTDLDAVDIAERQKQEICDLFVELFNHKQFTGRSGTFYKYEGLGSIYWHMVSKLHLAIGEILESAIGENADETLVKKLQKHFDEVKEGLGVHKKPEEYGAFPIDPYSHTPSFAGVQQPGMTGQVKEDILTRYAELGVKVEQGQLSFEPKILKKSELLIEEKDWALVRNGNTEKIKLAANSLGFSVCGIPVIYMLSHTDGIVLNYRNGDKEIISGNTLSAENSRKVFRRDEHIYDIRVNIQHSSFTS